MKLAEALILRSDLQKRIEQLRHRLTNNAKVQEGDAPAEKPEALLKELEGSATELEPSRYTAARRSSSSAR